MYNYPMMLLKSKNVLFLTNLILFSLGSASQAFAESAIQCHCFKNRSYNSTDRFAADEYILATSFNSLLARSFAIPKRQIVMIKMNEGVAQDDLLISLKVSKKTGIAVQEFFRSRKENKAWAEIISGLSQQEKIRNDPLLEALRSGLPVGQAGAMVTEEIIGDFFQIKPEEIKKLSMAGMNEKEMTLIYILAHAREQRPEVLVELYRKKGKSWSEIANDLGVEPAAAGKLILAYPAREISK